MRKTIKENKTVWPAADTLTPDQYACNQWLEKLDTAFCEVESRWGIGRLERLVSYDMAQKWKVQMEKLNKAISENDIFTLPELVNGTIRGFVALEANAVAQGHKPHEAPFAWTVGLPSGKTLAIVRHPKDASLVNDLKRDHGDVVVWTIDEIANIIEKEYTLVNLPSAKATVKAEPQPFDFTQGDKII
jgi:hypothetical protein